MARRLGVEATVEGFADVPIGNLIGAQQGLSASHRGGARPDGVGRDRDPSDGVRADRRRHGRPGPADRPRHGRRRQRRRRARGDQLRRERAVPGPGGPHRLRRREPADDGTGVGRGRPDGRPRRLPGGAAVATPGELLQAAMGDWFFRMPAGPDRRGALGARREHLRLRVRVALAAVRRAARRLPRARDRLRLRQPRRPVPGSRWPAPQPPTVARRRDARGMGRVRDVGRSRLGPRTARAARSGASTCPAQTVTDPDRELREVWDGVR